MESAQLARSLADAMAHTGSSVMYGVPGGGANLDIIGAAEQAGMRFVLAHAETPAAIMAAVHGDLTGTPTACTVTRGPGAMSAVNAVAQAALDHQPLVLVSDCVTAGSRTHTSHQLVDQIGVMAPLAKASVVIGEDTPQRALTELVNLTVTGRPGPVHLDFDPTASGTREVTTVPAPSSSTEISGVLSAIRESRRPVVIVGGQALGAVDTVQAWLSSANAPVLTTYRAKGIVDEHSPQAAGLFTGTAFERHVIEQGDLVIAVGLDPIEMLPGAWGYSTPVVSLASPEDVPGYLDPQAAATGNLAELVAAMPALEDTDWQHDTGQRHRLSLERQLTTWVSDAPDEVPPHEVVLATRSAAPEGTTITVDAGVHMLLAMSLWPVREPRHALISSGLATMGFAVPAAVAAAVVRPDDHVVAFTGDGGLGMCLAELETIVRYGLKVVTVVFNDSRLSLIELKQRAEGHGGANAIGYGDVDFAAVAHGFGMAAHTVTSTAQLGPAISEAFASDQPTLVDVRVDRSAYPGVLDTIRGSGGHPPR